MTRDTSRIRAVSLAALVLLSAVAGSVAFAGSAAAVSGVTEEAAFSPDSVDEDTLDTFSFNYSVSGVNTSDTVTANLTIPSAFTIEDASSVVLVNETGGTIDDNPTVQSDNNVTLSGSSATSTVYLRGEIDLRSPSVNSDQTYNPEVTASDNDGSASIQGSGIDILNDPLAVTDGPTEFSPSEGVEETTTQHNFNYTFTGVDTSADTTFSLSVPAEFTIEQENVVLRDADGTVVNSSADIVGDSVEIVDTPNTETVYLAGTVNVTSPAVPEGTEEIQELVKINASDSQTRSTGTSAELRVPYSGGSPGDPEFLSAIQYVRPSDDTPVVEVSFSEDVQNFGSSYALYVEGEGQLTNGNGIVSVSEAQGRAVIELDDTYSQAMTLNLQSGITDPDGNALSNTGNTSVRFAPTSVGSGESATAYKGANVSIVASASNTGVVIEATDDDNNYFFDGSTGTNSHVFVFATAQRAAGDYDADIDGESTASITVRSLGLSLSIDDRNVTNAGTIDGTVEARAGNREIRLELLDDDGELPEGVSERLEQLSGQGNYDFSYDLEQLSLETGEYTIRATDTTSGVTTESNTITVREAGDTEATFPNRIPQEERGDVAAITVELANTDEGTLRIGGDTVGYEANVTVRDAGGDDQDGQVTVYFNTYAATSYGTGSFSSENDVFSVSEDDEIVNGEVSLGVSNLLDAEIYPLEASVDGRVTDVAQLDLRPRETVEIRSWTAPRDRYGDLDNAEDVRAGTGDWVTRTSEAAFGDTVLYEIRASGLEGALDARGEDTVTSAFFAFANGTGSSPASRFTVEQQDPGPNRDPLVLQMNASNSRVIADAENDTYYVVTRTGEFGPAGVEDTDNDGAIDASENSYGEISDDDDLRASFTVFGDDENDLDLTESGDDEAVETTLSLTTAELTMNEPFNVTAASGQEVFGETTVAPGTELTIRVRSGDGVRPPFLKTGTTTVDSDGQFLVTLSFNDTSPGDPYTVTVTGTSPASDLEVDGTVQPVIPTATTDTPEETTTITTSTTTTDTPTRTTATPGTTTTEIPTVQTPTTTPGFGVATALIALAGAALLALRRE
ncbi:DUF7827 domain-containing protein [Halobellus clavatus]|uniref:PGF-CTERM protein n=1 Tax=Halobellus clavatus TaxID=660517 RepID=A0A1H3G8E0_9EURY|nr:BGTF surface domain-containing protein [Halobellus clavatus]SDX99546.1 PGF-CTERM protein [Halobellus clavatus]